MTPAKLLREAQHMYAKGYRYALLPTPESLPLYYKRLGLFPEELNGSLLEDMRQGKSGQRGTRLERYINILQGEVEK